jgi:hypothetical protein
MPSGHGASNSVALIFPRSCLGRQINALFLHTATCPMEACGGAKYDKFQLTAGTTKVAQNTCGKAIHITASRVWKVIPNYWNKENFTLCISVVLKRLCSSHNILCSKKSRHYERLSW